MDLRELYEQYATQIGKDELTDAEKKQAFLNAILEEKAIEPFVFILADTPEKKAKLLDALWELLGMGAKDEEVGAN